MSPASATPPAAPTTAGEHAPPALPAIDGHIQPVPIRPTYRLALLATAAAMLLLFLAYIALIGLIMVLIGLIYTKTDFAEYMLKNGSIGTLILFFMPGLVGCFVIGFMLKPLFAKYALPTPIILLESEEPELYAYVNRLCDMLGARRPSHIQVDCRANASAGFREGRKGLRSGQLVLTIGLPLAAGLTLRQFTGVLAHEFGHFAQGTGMRLAYIVRSIHIWFSSAVYERDELDHFIERVAHTGSIFSAWAWLVKFLTWPTRRILWVLMCIGNVVSTAMLRQMEFDADRYEARIAGSDQFEETSERIEALMLAEKKALDEINEACRKNRVCDDFNRLVIEHERATSPEALLVGLAKLQLRKSATDWFDTHPCHKDRVASAKRENAPGILRGDGPTRALFYDFDALSRRASELYYRKDLGISYDTTHLISTESMVAASDDHEAALRLLTRFFQGTINPICPLFPEPAPDLPATPEAITQHLAAARRHMLDLAETARTSLATFDAEDQHFISSIRSNASGRPLFHAEQQLHADRLLHAASFNAAVAHGMTQINIALSVAQRDQPTPNNPVFEALLALRNTAPALEQLRQNFYELDADLSLPQSDNRGESIRQLLDRAEKAQSHLQNIHTTLAAATYPYAPPGSRTSLSQYAIGRLPAPNEIGAIHTTAHTALKSLYTLYLRLLSDLARQTETLESSHGLPPLPDPPNTETLKENLRSRFKF